MKDHWRNDRTMVTNFPLDSLGASKDAMSQCLQLLILRAICLASHSFLASIWKAFLRIQTTPLDVCKHIVNAATVTSLTLFIKRKDLLGRQSCLTVLFIVGDTIAMC